MSRDVFCVGVRGGEIDKDGGWVVFMFAISSKNPLHVYIMTFSSKSVHLAGSEALWKHNY